MDWVMSELDLHHVKERDVEVRHYAINGDVTFDMMIQHSRYVVDLSVRVICLCMCGMFVFSIVRAVQYLLGREPSRTLSQIERQRCQLSISVSSYHINVTFDSTPTPCVTHMSSPSPSLLLPFLKVLSGGELQRFAISVVVVQKADVYMFDEPSSYLDVKQRLKVRLARRTELYSLSLSLYPPPLPCSLSLSLPVSILPIPSMSYLPCSLPSPSLPCSFFCVTLLVCTGCHYHPVHCGVRGGPEEIRSVCGARSGRARLPLWYNRI